MLSKTCVRQPLATDGYIKFEENWQDRSSDSFMFSSKDVHEIQFLHLLKPRETLMSLTVKSALAIKEKFTIKSQNRVAMVQTSWKITQFSSV